MKTLSTLQRSKLLYLFLLYASLGFLTPSNAQGIHIPAANFAAAIRAVCPTCINATDTLLPPAATLTTLNVSGKNIGNLTGIHGFSALRNLNCGQNNLITLPANLPTALSELYCSGNQLTTLTTLPAILINLYCEGNQISNLPILPNNLVDLFCSTNLLTSLPALPNSVKKIYCGL